jgi:hypothetical protein
VEMTPPPLTTPILLVNLREKGFNFNMNLGEGMAVEGVAVPRQLSHSYQGFSFAVSLFAYSSRQSGGALRCSGRWPCAKH